MPGAAMTGAVISTIKTPPVLGWRATSPRAVENVESSSCANWMDVDVLLSQYCDSRLCRRRNLKPGRKRGEKKKGCRDGNTRGFDLGT